MTRRIRPLKRKLIRVDETPATNSWITIDSGLVGNPTGDFFFSGAIDIYACGTDASFANGSLSSWSLMSNCSAVDGSPFVYVIRGSNGHLLSRPPCADLGEGLTSAPIVRAVINGHAYAYFRGSSGHLWARDINSTSHWDMGLSLP